MSAADGVARVRHRDGCNEHDILIIAVFPARWQKSPSGCKAQDSLNVKYPDKAQLPWPAAASGRFLLQMPKIERLCEFDCGSAERLDLPTGKLLRSGLRQIGSKPYVSRRLVVGERSLTMGLQSLRGRQVRGNARQQ